MSLGASEQGNFRLTDQYQSLKTGIHRHLIHIAEERNIQFDDWEAAQVERFVSSEVRRYVMDNRLPVNAQEAEALAEDARDELIGFGPIQRLVDDSTVNDIVVNGPSKVFVERKGLLESVPVRFLDNDHVIRIIQRILAPIGRRVDESNPMVDARLEDGSRVNAIIPPVALDGPCISIRKFSEYAILGPDLLRYGTVSQAELDYLQESVRARRSLLVVGGTGSGKTTFLNMLSQWIPPGERIVTIEDAAELRLEHNHVVRLETRPPNLDGERAVNARDLVRNALRMRPDRIVLGEVRGDEVLDMIQAMNTGHEGSMTTLHANSTNDAIHRLELLASFAGFTGSEHAFNSQIGAALDLIVHVTRLPSGDRRLMSVTEVTVQEDGSLQLVDRFRYDMESNQHQDLRGAA